MSGHWVDHRIEGKFEHLDVLKRQEPKPLRYLGYLRNKHSWPPLYIGGLSSNHLLYLSTKDYISQETRSDWLTWVACSPCGQGAMISSSTKPYCTNKDGVATERQRREAGQTTKATSFMLSMSTRPQTAVIRPEVFFCDFCISRVHLPLGYQWTLFLLGEPFLHPFGMNGAPDLHRRSYPGQFKPRSVQIFVLLVCLLGSTWEKVFFCFWRLLRI